MRQYAADQVTVGFTGIDLTDGLAVGSFIQEAPPPAAWRVRPNGVGGIVYSYHPNTSGTLTLQIDGSSTEHATLLGLYNADRATKSIVGVLYVYDASNKETAIYTKARILARPPVQKATTATVHAWTFGFESSFVQVLAPNRNVVGT